MACRGIVRRYAPGTCGGCGSSAHFRHCSSSCGGGCAPEASAVVCHKLDMYSAESISARSNIISVPSFMHHHISFGRAEKHQTKRAIDKNSRTVNTACRNASQDIEPTECVDR